MRIKTYVCYSKDKVIRKNSSSGGIFYHLAQSVLNRNGIVYAACYLDKNVCHKRITNSNELFYAQKSKYVESDISHIGDKLTEDLNNGYEVMFVGTPCQCSAILKNNEIFREQLVLVDFACHGIPDKRAWDAYLASLEKKNKTFERIDMRNKNESWKKFGVLTALDGHCHLEKVEINPYMRGFLHDLSLKSSCYSCAHKGVDRPTDITLADFWGIEEIVPEFDDDKGSSLVFVHSDKGNMNFKSITKEIRYMPTELAESIKYNPAITESVKAHKHRDAFWNRIDRGDDFVEIIEELLPYSDDEKIVNEKCNKRQMQHFDVGIMAVWSNNYGNILTNYALEKTLTDNGFSTLMIDNYNHDKLVPFICSFMHENYQLSSDFYEENELKELNSLCDAFVVGSDQAWNYNYSLYTGYGTSLHLNFVDKDKKMLSYATSFGKEFDNSPIDLLIQTSYLLKRFDGISVREESGINILKNKFDINESTYVLDPVFICKKEYFDELANKSSIDVVGKFVFAYFLDLNENKRNLIQYISNKLGYKVFCIEDLFKTIDIDHHNINDWLFLLRESEFVITDSFHGTAMSIIYGKQFLTIKNRQEERFKLFENIPELQPCILENIANLDDTECAQLLHQIDSPIDYDKVNSLLKKEKERSLTWLISNLKKKKNDTKEISFSFDYAPYIINSEKMLTQMKELTDYVEQLEISKAWCLEQINNKENHITQLNAVVDEMKLWNQEMETAKSWYLEQIHDKDEQVKQLQVSIEELRVWCNSLQQGKYWLGGQNENIRKEIENKDSYIRELQERKEYLEKHSEEQEKYIQELIAGKEYLEKHSQEQEKYIQELITGR